MASNPANRYFLMSAHPIFTPSLNGTGVTA
jgi:hypothetical protein